MIDQSVNYDEWQTCGHSDEPRDQQRDLFAHYWAEVGPDERETPDGWSWTVLDFAADNTRVAGSLVADEQAAKKAVQQWISANRPADTA